MTVRSKSPERIVLAFLAMAALNSTAVAKNSDASICRGYAKKQQWIKAEPICAKAAVQGDSDSQFLLGWIYENGAGVAKDYKQAVRWYTLAAEQGNAGGQFMLGEMLRNGLGIAQNYSQAVRWFTLAAEQGDAYAQHNLGTSYYEGQGNAKDYVRAHMWFNLAAVSGNENSVKGREVVASKMTPEQIAQAQQMATKCRARNYKAC